MELLKFAFEEMMVALTCLRLQGDQLPDIVGVDGASDEKHKRLALVQRHLSKALSLMDAFFIIQTTMVQIREATVPAAADQTASPSQPFGFAAGVNGHAGK